MRERSGDFVVSPKGCPRPVFTLVAMVTGRIGGEGGKETQGVGGREPLTKRGPIDGVLPAYTCTTLW